MQPPPGYSVPDGLVCQLRDLFTGSSRLLELGLSVFLQLSPMLVLSLATTIPLFLSTLRLVVAQFFFSMLMI